MNDDQMLPTLRTRLRDLSADFKSRLNILLGDLAYQPDVDMRFLGVVMNFNDVYEPIRPNRRKPTTTSRDKEKEKERERAKRKAAGTAASANAGSGTESTAPKEARRE
jgi:gamma-tubulin complex component 3